MKNEFFKTTAGRLAVTAISYAVCFAIYWIFIRVSGITLSNFGIHRAGPFLIIAALVMGWSFAGKAIQGVVSAVNNALFMGNGFLFGPIKMFVQFFLIRLALRFVIAALAGPFVFPYTVGKFVNKKISAAPAAA